MAKTFRIKKLWKPKFQNGDTAQWGKRTVTVIRPYEYDNNGEPCWWVCDRSGSEGWVEDSALEVIDHG